MKIEGWTIHILNPLAKITILTLYGAVIGYLMIFHFKMLLALFAYFAIRWFILRGIA